MMDAIVQFINKLQMTSVGALMNQVLSTWVIVYFTIVSSRLMLSATESHHANGFQIALAVFGYIGYKVTVNAASNHGNRATAREAFAGKAAIAEAAERGKKVGAAEARVVETEAVERQARLSGAFQPPPTGEHPAQNGAPTNQINVGIPVPPLVADPPPELDAPDDHEWKEGDPKAGVV